MNRRTLVLGALTVGGFGLTARRLTALAQDATPVPDSGLPIVLWRLDELADGDGVLVTPDDAAVYTIQFLPDGRIAGQADCNRLMGGYEVEGNQLALGPLGTTRAMCPPGSLFDRYVQDLENVAEYALQIGDDANDRLVLSLAGGGMLTFRPSLTGVVWQWREFQGGDGAVVIAADPSRYTLEFLDDGSLLVQADCNGGGGSATIAGSLIDLTVFTTLIACEDSQDSDFLRYLNEANSFVIQNGELALALPADAGIAAFQPVLAAAEPEATPTG